MSYLPRIAQASPPPPIQLTREELAYYARHILLPGIGTSGQRKLKAARVLVVGSGGLGCPVLQALAGAGVGRLTVLDADAVALSNLSRQWLHRHADAGRNKALSAQRTLRALNPFIEVAAQPAIGRLVSFDAAGLALQSFRLPGVRPPARIADPADALGAHGVSAEALRQALSIHEPLQLLDLRSRSQYETGSIAGADHCPAEQILEEGLPGGGASRTVLYCQEGGISQILVDALQSRENAQLQHLEGGYEAWKSGLHL